MTARDDYPVIARHAIGAELVPNDEARRALDEIDLLRYGYETVCKTAGNSWAEIERLRDIIDRARGIDDFDPNWAVSNMLCILDEVDNTPTTPPQQPH